MTDNGILSSLAPQNLRDLIEEKLRTAIFRGVFKPGEHLVESAIASQLGVSRAPVREVLSALQREGLVVNIPRRGNFVIDFTRRDIEEIYDLRSLLECSALKLLIQNDNPDDIKNLQRLVDMLKNIQNPEDTDEVDMQFHDYICRESKQSRLYQSWKNLKAQTNLLISITSKTHDNAHPPSKEHEMILDAIIAKDDQLAVQKLKEHLEDAFQRADAEFRELHSQRN
ncbi:MAG: GntR family transcriptional regulator [Anaerolineaceae bacterium]|nr:GntR family transcriptional regulator [Anaerolineaceae bacterium]